MALINIDHVLDASPIMAVVTIEEAEDAPAVARALMAGGVRSIEVTLRTPAGLEAIRRIAGEVENALVGAGTVIAPADLEAAVKAGARFAVSPGATPALLDAGRDAPIPYLPAIATASEIMQGLARGYTAFKAFPASSIGMAALSGFAGPFADVRFCPTGGVTAATAADYLALPNVACVGGSWLTPAAAVRAKDWAAVQRLAADSLARLGRGLATA